MGYQSGRGGQRPGAGRPSPWNNPKTVAIRVPEVLANQVLEYARKLDMGETTDNVHYQDFDLLAQNLLSDTTLTRNGKDKGTVKRVIERIKQVL